MRAPGWPQGIFAEELMLDEIATVPHTTQVRLLRVLQERELERVGGEQTIPVDVRIITATNASSESLLSDGTFREDLFYRLHVVPMVLPPLREFLLEQS